MVVLKCPVCGNENVEVNAELTVGKCEYCDSTFLIPKEVDKKHNLYNRAVFLRQNKEFDKAISAYEDILKEDNTDAEAHWGILLSKYGIEYVPDEKTGEYIPTFHRTDVESLLADPDYLAALEYSDPHARNVLEQEGRRLNEIQKSILEISQKETPYDIFICYKESDNDGRRTEDSILAQDIYYELTKRDYKVFFSRKTLEHRLGEEFEPIIYSALSSAKVMIIVGTTPENFSSVWVQNEWSRFLKMSRTSQKYIIPAYRGMSPYGLPVELSALQALDMSKLGFMQDLLDGIERFLKEKINKENNKMETDGLHAAIPGILPFEKLIRNGNTCINLDDYEAAQKCYQQAIEYYPEEYLGWWGMIKCVTNNLETTLDSLEQVNRYWENIRRLASEEEFKEIETHFSKYLDKYALLDYKRLIDNIQGKCCQQEKYYHECEDNIENLKREISNASKYAEKNIKDTYESTEWFEQKKSENEKELKHLGNSVKKIALYGVGTAIFTFLLIFIITIIRFGEFDDSYARSIAAFVIIATALIVLYKSVTLYDNRNTLEKDIQSLDLNISRNKKIILEFEKEKNSIVREKDNEIKRIEREVLHIRKSIEKSRDFLDLDRNLILPYFQNNWYKLYQIMLMPYPDENVLVEYKSLLEADFLV